MDLEKLKVVDLRKELQQRGLDTKGNKAVLVKRLKDAMDKESDKGTGKAASVAEASDGDGSHNEEDEQSGEEPEEPKKVELKSSRKEEVQPVIKEEAKSPKKDVKSNLKAEPKSPEKKPKVEVKEELSDAISTNTESPEKDSQAESQGTQSQLDTNGDQSEDAKATDDEEKEDENMETEAVEARGEKRKRDDEDTEDVETRGEKRRRDEKSTPEKPPVKKRERTPPKEDEPEIDNDKPQLSWYDSDLHLQLEKKSFLSAKPLNDGCMGYIWAGARATHGVSSGKVCFEVKITEELKWEDPSKYMQERKERENQSHRYKIDRRKERNRVKKDADTKEDGTPTSDDDKDKKGSTEKVNETAATAIEESENAGDSEKMETEEAPAKEQPETVTVEEKEEDKKEENAIETEQNEEKGDEEVETKNSEEDKKDDEEKTEPDQEKEKTEEKPKPEPIPAHYFRVGFSLLGTSLQLGEVKNSFAYESSGKFITDKQFQDYGVTFGVGDVVGAYVSIDDEAVNITYTVNGALQPTAITVPRSEFPEENFVLFPHVLSRNYAYEINLGANEEPWFPHPEELLDYQFLQAFEEKVAGPRRPEIRGDCEVILMIGLPGSGKTTWVKKHLESTTDKVYTVIGNNPIFERMTVDGQPLKTRFGGSWKMLVDKIQKCLNTLTDIASLRRRNFVIDQVTGNKVIGTDDKNILIVIFNNMTMQGFFKARGRVNPRSLKNGKPHHQIALQGSAITTNVFPNAQRRKLRAFEGFKRKAVCVICEDDEHARRQKEHENDYGKSVPESTMLDLKAQMELPETCEWLEELIFTDLNEEEARKKLKEYTEEANKKGYFRRWHSRQDDKRNPRGFRDRRAGYGGGGRYDRNDRYSQGGWSRPGSGGWGRDRRDNRGPPPRQDAWRQSARGPRSQERERPRDSRSGYGGGRSGGRNADDWQSSGSGGWGGGNSQGGWNAQMYGSHGYGAWNQQGQGWKFGGNQSGYGSSGQGGYGSGQSGYGSSQGGYGGGQYGGAQGGYGGSQGGYGQQNWNYYGQYSQQQGWGNSQAQPKGKASGQQANYSQQDWAQYAKQYAQQQQAQARRK